MSAIREELCSIMTEMGFPTLDEEQESTERKWANFALALAEQRRRMRERPSAYVYPTEEFIRESRRGRCCTGPFGTPEFPPLSNGAYGESELPWPHMVLDEIADRTEARARATLDEVLEIKRLFMEA